MGLSTGSTKPVYSSIDRNTTTAIGEQFSGHEVDYFYFSMRHCTLELKIKIATEFQIIFSYRKELIGKKLPEKHEQQYGFPLNGALCSTASAALAMTTGALTLAGIVDWSTHSPRSAKAN